MKIVGGIWTNWSGSVSCRPRAIVAPLRHPLALVQVPTAEAGEDKIKDERKYEHDDQPGDMPGRIVGDKPEPCIRSDQVYKEQVPNDE